jgi:hypothetical protein
VVCLGSKGGRFKQLVKGEDDIRQDAVMEQVFGCVNELMARQDYRQGEMESVGGQGKASTNKPLKLVTYSIVPLSPASGVSNAPCFIVCSGLISLTQAALLGSGMGRQHDTIRRLYHRHGLSKIEPQGWCPIQVLPRRMGE